MNEELTGQKKSLQTEQVPLQPENPQLESEIQKLQLNLEQIKSMSRKFRGNQSERKCTA